MHRDAESTRTDSVRAPRHDPEVRSNGQVESGWREQGRRIAEAARPAGYVAAIVVNAIMLYVVHNLLRWGVPFITPSFADVLWAFDLSFSATIIANALFISYDARWFRRLARVVLDGFALVVGYTLYDVFPFDFGELFSSDLARLVLLLLMASIVIAAIVDTIRLVADLVQDQGSVAE